MSVTAIAVAAIIAIAATAITIVLNSDGEISDGNADVSTLSGTVTVGSATDQPGLMTLVSGANQTVGFDADVAYWLGGNSNPSWRPQFSPVAVEARVDALKKHSVGAVIQTFSITDARLKEIDMAGPYLVNYQGILVRTGEAARYPNGESLRGVTACAPKGTTSIVELQSRGAHVTGTSSVSECVDLLRNRTVAVASTDQLVLYGYAQRYPDVEVVANNRFGLREDYGVGLPYGSYAECLELTKSILRLLDGPDWDAFLRKNFGDFDTTPFKPIKLNDCKKRS